MHCLRIKSLLYLWNPMKTQGRRYSFKNQWWWWWLVGPWRWRWSINQPAISVGSVTSLEPSQTVLNCSGTGNSLCGTTKNLTVKTTTAHVKDLGKKLLNTRSGTSREATQSFSLSLISDSHIRHLVVSWCSSQSSWHWLCHSWGSPYSGRPGSPLSCWWKWWELFPEPRERHLAVTYRYSTSGTLHFKM